ncbi:hypothetical protein CROQUDRAFT_55502, partial [Cronartium quercuum f. sp. fusiforme G11]
QYHETSRRIFQKPKIKLNHHYSLHILNQIRFWGPLNSITKFSDERLIGVLQKIKTNSHLSQMDCTMMTRFNQWQRLLADHPGIEDLIHVSSTEQLTDPAKSHYRIQLETEEYKALLAHLQVVDSDIRDYRNMPHPPDGHILQPYAILRAMWRISKDLLVLVVKPNHCIQYKFDGKKNYSFIRQIYQFSNPSQKWQTILLFNPIKNLYPKDTGSPSSYFHYIVFLLKCVVGKIDPQFIILSPQNVCCVCAFHLLPAQVFGIEEGGIIIWPFDFKSQLDIF